LSTGVVILLQLSERVGRPVSDNDRVVGFVATSKHVMQRVTTRFPGRYGDQNRSHDVILARRSAGVRPIR